MFFWEKGMQYSQTCWNFFSRNPKKIIESVVFSNKSVLYKGSSGNIECSSDYPVKNFSPEDREKLWICVFFKNKVSPKIFLWKMRMQFWQYVRNFFNRSPKKIFEPITFPNKSFAQKCSSEIIENSFDNPAKKFSTEERRDFMNKKIFSNKTFLTNCFSGKIKRNFDNPSVRFSPAVRGKTTIL